MMVALPARVAAEAWLKKHKRQIIKIYKRPKPQVPNLKPQVQRYDLS